MHFAVTRGSVKTESQMEADWEKLFSAPRLSQTVATALVAFAKEGQTTAAKSGAAADLAASVRRLICYRAGAYGSDFELALCGHEEEVSQSRAIVSRFRVDLGPPLIDDFFAASNWPCS